jgi:ubiquinone/menaquinone biosynthesis C-methylase UbiE
VTEPELATARAVYDATAERYAQVVGTDVNAACEGPLDRACLNAFSELPGLTAGRVADVGCGPGRVAGFLAARGLTTIGLDMAHAMLTVGRRAHSDVPFAQGCLTALPFRDQSLAGAVCWYSIIHTAPTELHAVLAELRRTLADRGHLLVAFQVGEGEAVTRTDAYGTGLTLTSYRHRPDDVVRSLRAAGLDPHAQAVREPEFEHESSPQMFIFARRVQFL